LPFPADIAHDRLASLGPVPSTSYEDGIRATADIFRRLAADGKLVPAEQGLPAMAGT
jgi:hypothetical protein